MIILTSSTCLISSCGQKGGGFAPSWGDTTEPLPYSGSILQNGTTVTNSSGWSAEAIIANPIKTTNSSNGWTAEVRYE